jgi:hypothetical protein
MVLKRKKIENTSTNTSRRKGYRSRSSESQLRNKRKAYDHRARAAILEAETLMGYYKDLLK